MVSARAIGKTVGTEIFLPLSEANSNNGNCHAEVERATHLACGINWSKPKDLQSAFGDATRHQSGFAKTPAWITFVAHLCGIDKGAYATTRDPWLAPSPLCFHYRLLDTIAGKPW
jgi:hypothetical protein